jgi:two-component system chemotaxis sensor kinase CheA
MHTVGGQAVMRLRDSVMPLIDLHRRLGEHGNLTVGDKTGEEARRFAVVVRVGSQCAGLLVDRLVGQQEVVIKPLDDKYTAGGPFSGATIREDGEVSLILDVVRLVREPADGMLSAA